MAQIWLWRDGDSRTNGGPLVELPLADSVTKLRIARKDYCGDLCTPPRFETFEHPPTRGVRVVMGSPNLRGYQHVIMRLDETEAQANGWTPGFYRSPVSPEDACRLLSPQGRTRWYLKGAPDVRHLPRLSEVLEIEATKSRALINRTHCCTISCDRRTIIRSARAVTSASTVVYNRR